MPPKKASSKKASTKTTASVIAVDAKLPNNGEKEVVEELLTNGSSLNDVDETKETAKSKTTKRSSGRAKNVVNELETEAPPVNKKPAAKGRGKKKLNENEVIENEVVETVKENEVDEKEPTAETDAGEEVVTKTKGKKKEEAKTKKTAKSKENKKAAKTEESIAAEEQPSETEEAKVTEKKTKAATGRKKKRETVSKPEEEEVKVKEEIEEKVVEEKAPKKSGRSSKKEKAATLEVEPAKKKGKSIKKDQPSVDDEVEVSAVEEEEAAEEVKAEVKEKKPTKRGRAAAKVSTEDLPVANGDSEEVLPKKRSRKAPSAEKEVVAEKPKRGRAKKAEKKVEKVSEETTSGQGKEEDDDIANGQVKQETIEENKESPKTIEKAEPPAAKTKGGRKRAAPSTNNKKSAKKTTDEDDNVLDDGVDNTEELEDEADGSKPSKTKKKKTDTAPLNATATKYNKDDFELPPPAEGQTIEEPRFNLKISSWNVAGLRSWLKKEGLLFLEYEQPDIFCMQETKCTTDQLPEEVERIPGYHPYWLCMPGGYAGVAIYSKIMPINVEYGIGNKEFDDCGRIITAEYEKFFLINVYVPNSGRKLVNLEARMRWEKLFQEFVQNLDSRKPVVICGDMNVSHQEIDLANPKTNTRNAGFTKEERDKMSELLALGFVDTFRHLYPERKGAYTFWTYMGNARSRNVGWRLDYFIVSERFIKRVVDNCIRSQCMGSDHCPITLFLKL